MFFTLWVIVTITFFLMNTLPGDPVQTSTKILPDIVAENIKVKWGLDKPVMERYFIYLQNLAQGNLGESYKQVGVSANEIFADKMPASIRLGAQATVVGLVIGITIGVLAAFNRNTAIDYFSIFIAIIGVSVPSFVIAALLQTTLTGNMLPVFGWPEPGSSFFDGIEYTVLPTIAAAFGGIATYSRFMRSSVLDTMNNDYILTAKAKGLSQSQIIRRHVLKNSSTPIISIVAPSIAGIFTGSFVLERIFGVPGMGKYYVESVNGRDFPMIMATTLMFSFIFILSIVVMDILYAVVDPRVRKSIIDG